MNILLALQVNTSQKVVIIVDNAWSHKKKMNMKEHAIQKLIMADDASSIKK